MTITEITSALMELNRQHETFITRLVQGVVDANLTPLEKTRLLNTLMERFNFLFTEPVEAVVKVSKFTINFFSTAHKEIVLRETGFWIEWAGNREEAA